MGTPVCSNAELQRGPQAPANWPATPSRPHSNGLSRAVRGQQGVLPTHSACAAAASVPVRSPDESHRPIPSLLDKGGLHKHVTAHT